MPWIIILLEKNPTSVTCIISLQISASLHPKCLCTRLSSDAISEHKLSINCCSPVFLHFPQNYAAQSVAGLSGSAYVMSVAIHKSLILIFLSILSKKVMIDANL